MQWHFPLQCHQTLIIRRTDSIINAKSVSIIVILSACNSFFLYFHFSVAFFGLFREWQALLLRVRPMFSTQCITKTSFEAPHAEQYVQIAHLSWPLEVWLMSYMCVQSINQSKIQLVTPLILQFVAMECQFNSNPCYGVCAHS